jgi:Tol biopolymer transport system component
MSPVFSPDGARIAYTTVDSEFRWDTWLVPALGGEPQRWLRNASGLAWTGPRQVLFSEMKKGVHMGIVAAEESGIGGRDVYLPASELGMAHRSYLSPDGKSVLLVEMDHDHLWVPCRLVPMDGSSQGRSVGPPRATCTFAAWSPDGKWMYFSSLAGGSSHIWRQRFPDGQPQQMTSGPTVEEGIAMAPDGRSFVTAVALETSSLLVHDASGERQISLEGNAANPKFTPDGKKLCYQIQKEAPDERQFMSRVPGEIWVSDLQSGHSEPLVPGLQALDYDISTDGQQIVMEVEDGQGKPQLWLASFERQSPPRQVPNAEGRQPRFGPDGEIFFRSSDSAYRVRSDGTGLRKAIEQPIAILRTLSPDGRWLVAWAPTPGDGPAADQVFPLGGGPAVLIGGGSEVQWSRGGGAFSLTGGVVAEGRTYLIPLAPGEVLPRIPAGGLRSEEDVARLPGARRVDDPVAVPGPSPDVYAFLRTTTQRNLYRIPIQ